MPAPRRLLVGPEATVKIGNWAALSARIAVPSFWLMKRWAGTAARKPATVRSASGRSIALRSVAFSRSRIPKRPMRCDRRDLELGVFALQPLRNLQLIVRM